MRRLLFMLCLGTALCLTGCSQPIEKAPVIIKDEKTPQVTPIPAKASEKPTEDTISIKEHLQDVTTLDNAISPFYISDAQGAVEWRLQKCDGGFGFYYPVYGDDDIRAWNMPKPTNTEEDFIMGINVYSSKSRMQIVISNPLEYATLEDAKDHLFSFNGTSTVYDCTIGIHDYPAYKTDRSYYMADTNTGGGPPTEPMYSQYYLVKCPEGVLRIWLSSPVDGTEDSWSEVEKMLNTFIIESESDYARKNSAMPIITDGKNLQFEDRDTLSKFYTTCIMQGDYKSALAVSQNTVTNDTASKTWRSMKCHTTSVTDIMMQNDRAVEPIFLSLERPDNTGLPESGDEESSLIRYIYFIKNDNYWYVDGPLHNTEPPEEWWQGQDFTWSSENYGLSDSSEIGQLITTQKEKDNFIIHWAKKCE